MENSRLRRCVRVVKQFLARPSRELKKLNRRKFSRPLIRACENRRRNDNYAHCDSSIYAQTQSAVSSATSNATKLAKVWPARKPVVAASTSPSVSRFVDPPPPPGERRRGRGTPRRTGERFSFELLCVYVGFAGELAGVSR